MRWFARAAVLPLAMAIGACTESMPTEPDFDGALAAITVPNAAEKVVVCKDGPASTQPYSFSISLAPSGTNTPTQGGRLLVTNPFTLNAGECKDVADQGGGINVTLQELIPSGAGFEFEKIEVWRHELNAPAPVLIETLFTNDPLVREYGDAGLIVVYYNKLKEEPPEGGQGCTPGFWKQPQHFTFWPAPYTPSTLFSAVFEDAFPGKTLLQVASLGGGGLNALGRHTVAALLSAGAVNYAFTPQQVIDAFNAVFPGGDYSSLQKTFETQNELLCPFGTPVDIISQ